MLVEVRARLETGNNECRKRRIQTIPESVLFTPPFLPPQPPRVSNIERLATAYPRSCHWAQLSTQHTDQPNIGRALSTDFPVCSL